MHRLDNPIQNYAWGSPSAIPTLLGRAPDGKPQAELWLGAHPSAPSRLEDGQTLLQHIAESPEESLGASTVRRFGPTLPFLLKVLAAGKPLSLQAHPSLAQAKEGFAKEEAAGLLRTASNRNYRDANHKPEIICALSPFHALCGFRRLADTITLFRQLGLDTTRLERDGLARWFEWLLTTPERSELATQALAAARRHTSPECAWAVRLGEQYPGDVGLIGALALNLVTLAPGQALYLPAGNLHAYLEGTGIELMANSDNVLRGGLTPKHVDVPELLRVLDFADGPVQVLEPADGIYQTPAPDFELAQITLSGPVTLSRRGPDLLLVTSGTAQTGGLTLKAGQSAFIDASEGTHLALDGHGVVWRATVGR